MIRTTHTAQMATSAAGARPCTELGHASQWPFAVQFTVKPYFTNLSTGNKRPARHLGERTT
jgi:hypothetical protein